VAPYLSPAQHLLILVAAGLAVTAVAGVMLLRGALPVAPEARRERHPSARAVRGAGLFAVGVLGLIALCDTYGEGAIGDWGALHIRENLHTDQRVAAAGYAAYALAAAVGRLGGTALLQRLGHTRVLVAGGLVAGAGTLLAALAPVLWLVFVGFAIAGLGLANIFPTAMARVGYLAGATGVAIGSTLGYTGFLLGPPAIGFLAGAVGLPVALTTVPLLAFAVAAIAYSASRASRSAEIAENEEVYG
jgi:fucose permease